MSEILAAIKALGDRLDGRIDALGDRLDGRIDALGDRLDGRIDALDHRMDAGFAGVTTEFGVVHAEIAEVKVGVQECIAAINATHDDLTGLGDELHAHLTDELRHRGRRA